MFKDSRGTLLFPIKDNQYIDKSINISKDCTYSINKKNVLRGLHINTFGKLITCINGSFIDFMIHPETLDFKYYYIKQGDQIYCPGNYAHGFITLEENSILSYHCEGFFGNEAGGLLNYKDPIVYELLMPIFDKYNIDETKLIMNDKDSNAPFLNFDYFLLGKNGFIGSYILNELKNQNKKVYPLQFRLDDTKNIKKYIEAYKPKYLINAAGLTGTPDTKWCNTHQKQTLLTNVINQINILNLCHEYNVHCTVIGSGAIFNSSKEPIYSHTKGNIVSTPEFPNYYAECRIMLEELIKPFNNCLLLRINYPLSTKSNSKNLINKLLMYPSIENISLSVTFLDSMIPKLPKIIEDNKTGIVNFVNQGQLNIPTFIKKYIDYYRVNMNKEYKDSDRESPKLICDNLDEYFIEDINYALSKYIFKN